MRITFIGTSSGSPRANKKCSCTLIEVSDRKYLIDVGTLVTEQLENRAIELCQINAVFITHMHRDHTDGLPSFIQRINPESQAAADPDIFLPPPMQLTLDAIKMWMRCNGVENFRTLKTREVQEGEIFDDGFIKVTAYRTAHSEYSYSYLIEAEGKRVLFSGDLSKTPEQDFPYAALTPRLDLAVCELGHFTADKYDLIFNGQTAPKKLCINHCSTKFIDTAYVFKRNSKIPTVIANDSMIIDV